MASATTYINVTPPQVQQFLIHLLEKQGKGMRVTSSPTSAAAAAAVGDKMAAAAEAPAGSAAAAGMIPLRLHPRVDAVHPFGEAHSSRDLEAALSMYKQFVKDAHFVIDEIMVHPDKALVTGHQIITSRLAALPSLLPLPHQLQHSLADYLPSLTEGKVPTTIQLRFGKSDNGDPVVTHLSLSFSLLSVLLPHLVLQPWQSNVWKDVSPQLLNIVQSAGSLASVAEDVGTSLSATWRASTAVLQATLGKVLGEVKDRLYSQANDAAGRVANTNTVAGEVNGAHA